MFYINFYIFVSICFLEPMYIDRKDTSYDETKQKKNDLSSFVRMKDLNFKVYLPLWDLNKSEQSNYDVDKYVIMIKHSQLRSTIDKIDQIIHWLDQPISLNEILSCTSEFYEAILKSYENIFSDVKIDETSITANDDSIELSISNKTAQELSCLYKKLLNFCFPQNLLSVFTQRYCLSDSDGTLLMLEYLRFLAITKAFGIEYYPSLWILEFWRHHISFNTKSYREFVENVFNGDMYFSNFDEKECLNRDNKEDREKYEEVYNYFFGSNLPKSIWPDTSLEEKSDWFVYLNLFKTFTTKCIIRKINSLYQNEKSNYIYEDYKDATIQSLSNCDKSVYCQQNLTISSKLMREACVLENDLNISKKDNNDSKQTVNPTERTGIISRILQENLNDEYQYFNQNKFPADPLLVNWRSKYEKEDSDKEEIKNSIDNCNDDDILSSNGLIFSNYDFAQLKVNNTKSALEFVDFIETPFNQGPKVQSLYLMVAYI